MKTWKVIFVALSGLFFSLALITSCKKDGALKSYTFDATIKDTGDPAADGCGWQLIADSTYHPLNLDDQYKKDGLKVTVTFHKPGPIYYCTGFSVPQITVQHGFSDITIDKIQVKQ